MTPSASSSAVCLLVDWPTSADEFDGADATSDGRTTNAAIAIPRIARLTSTILRVRRAGADSDALWCMPPRKTEDCCGGVCDFRYARDTRNPRQGCRPFQVVHGENGVGVQDFHAPSNPALRRWMLGCPPSAVISSARPRGA